MSRAGGARPSSNGASRSTLAPTPHSSQSRHTSPSSTGFYAPQHHHKHHNEQDEQPVSEGYMELAGLMSSYPEGAIFRRFRELTMLHLLQMQSRLQDLETRYVNASAMRGGTLFSSTYTNTLHMPSAADVRDLSPEQRDVLNEMGPLVDHYSKQTWIG